MYARFLTIPCYPKRIPSRTISCLKDFYTAHIKRLQQRLAASNDLQTFCKEGQKAVVRPKAKVFHTGTALDSSLRQPALFMISSLSPVRCLQRPKNDQFRGLKVIHFPGLELI
jgi:hypothetical protein